MLVLRGCGACWSSLATLLYTLPCSFAVNVGGAVQVTVKQDGEIWPMSIDDLPDAQQGLDPGAKYMRHAKLLQRDDMVSMACNPGDCCNVLAPENGGPGDCYATLPNNSACQPSCNAGFSSTGTFSCRNSVLTASTCVVDGCKAGPAPDNGTYGTCPPQGTPMKDAATCEPTCAAGHVLKEKATCNRGTFKEGVCTAAPCVQVHVPKCTPLVATQPCSSPGSCRATMDSGSSCLPTCAEGFKLTPPATTPVSSAAPLQYHCREGVLQASTCEPAPCEVTDVEIPKGMSYGNCPLNMTSGSSCQPQCLPDPSDPSKVYALSQVKNQITCDHGKFSALAECAPAGCNLQTLLPNGLANGDLSKCPALLAHGASCQPQCSAGFTLSNPSPTCKFGKLDPIECVASGCSFAMPEHGTASDCSQVVPSGSSCTVQCSAGYQAAGEYKCAQGKFTTTGECKPIPCTITLQAHEGKGDCPVAPAEMPDPSECMLTCLDGTAASGKTVCNVGKLEKRTSCDLSPCVVPAENQGGTCGGVLARGDTCNPKCPDGTTVQKPSTCDQARVFQPGVCAAAAAATAAPAPAAAAAAATAAPAPAAAAATVAAEATTAAAEATSIAGATAPNTTAAAAPAATVAAAAEATTAAGGATTAAAAAATGAAAASTAAPEASSSAAADASASAPSAASTTVAPAAGNATVAETPAAAR